MLTAHESVWTKFSEALLPMKQPRDRARIAVLRQTLGNEGAAGMDILCTDKTGTLTEGVGVSAIDPLKWDECKLPGQHHD